MRIRGFVSRLLKNTPMEKNISCFNTIISLTSQYIESVALSVEFGLPSYNITVATENFCKNVNNLFNFKLITGYELTPKSVSLRTYDNRKVGLRF